MILHVVGARPNFVKMAPVILECQRRGLRQVVVHTGQHYDPQMSKVFFDDLNLPKSAFNLNVKSSSSSEQIAKIMIAFEEICLAKKPSLIIVPGDVNSSLACAMVASNLNIPLVHLESGLRSFDGKMQEEKNRIMIDHLSDLLFVTEKSAMRNLKREGVPSDKIFFCGNTMIDSLKKNSGAISERKVCEKLGLKKRKYILMTMHRPGNVDDDENFKRIIQIVQRTSTYLPIIFPMHPRILKNKIQALQKIKNLRLIEALGYLDFIHLMQNARLVMTDSGGVQEETTYLGVPCLTLRENTERPVTVTQGSNKIVGLNSARVAKELQRILATRRAKRGAIEKWDGRAAVRVVSVIEKYLAQNHVNKKNFYQ